MRQTCFSIGKTCIYTSFVLPLHLKLNNHININRETEIYEQLRNRFHFNSRFV
jgi:hypothetical protein